MSVKVPTVEETVAAILEKMGAIKYSSLASRGESLLRDRDTLRDEAIRKERDEWKASAESWEQTFRDAEANREKREEAIRVEERENVRLSPNSR